MQFSEGTHDRNNEVESDSDSSYTDNSTDADDDVENEIISYGSRPMADL